MTDPHGWDHTPFRAADRPSVVPPPLLPSSPPRPPWQRSLWVKILAGALSAGTVCGVVAYGNSLGGPESAEVTPLSSAGPHPFTRPAGADQPGTPELADAGGAQRGDSSQLYAQDPAQLPCDGRVLVDELRADPARAAAWAQVQRVPVERIPEFVAGLTPVLLRADTAVVDYGYRDGAFVPAPTVLATGTAVFINGYGEPTVKCFNGDPLTRGAAAGADVTVVDPAPVVIPTYALVHPGSGDGVEVPGGGDPCDLGPGREPVTGAFNYDGSVLLSDGRILLADGQIVTVTPPPGALPQDDGSYLLPDGRLLNADGSERLPITRGGMVFHPDGTVTDADNNPLTVPDGWSLRFNHDGTLTLINGNRVTVFDTNGEVRSSRQANSPATLNPDGSITQPDGTVENPDGTVREPVELPDGGTLESDGSTTADTAASSTASEESARADAPPVGTAAPEQDRTPVVAEEQADADADPQPDLRSDPPSAVADEPRADDRGSLVDRRPKNPVADTEGAAAGDAQTTQN